MSWDNPNRYDGCIAQALATPGGHLGIGRGGFILHFKNSRLSGYDCALIKQVAADAGLPVIDSRMVPFELVATLAVRGRMIAVNTEPSPRPWHGLAYAPLAAVAAAYRKARAEILNLPEDDEHGECFDAMPPGPASHPIEFWLGYVRETGEMREAAMRDIALITFTLRALRSLAAVPLAS